MNAAFRPSKSIVSSSLGFPSRPSYGQLADRLKRETPTPRARLTPTCRYTESGCNAKDRCDPPISTFHWRQPPQKHCYYAPNR